MSTETWPPCEPGQRAVKLETQKHRPEEDAGARPQWERARSCLRDVSLID